MRPPIVLFAAALAVRVLAAAVHPDPAYPDSFYYVNVARALAAGDGFTVDYVWNFVDVGGRLPHEPTLPIPSNAHWMPLAQLVQVPFVWLLGPTAIAAGLPFWLIGAAAAPLTWWIARDAGFDRFTSSAAGGLVAMPMGTTPFLAQPDNFAPFMLLGALALWLAARAMSRIGIASWQLYALGGAVVGLATLSRNDGVLLGIPYALGFLAERVTALRTAGRALVERVRAAGRIGWPAAVLCALTFAVVVAPWLARQLAVFGSVSPSAASGRILWITDYGQLFSISGETSLESFLAQGPAALLASRITGLIDAIKWFTVAPLLVFLVPALLAGGWRHRRDAAFRPWFVYAISLFAFSALLFAVHVDHGTFLHSAVALVPHAYLLSVAGVAVIVEAVAQRLPHWNAARARRNFTVIVLVVALVGTVAGTARIASGWHAQRALRAPIFAALAAAPEADRVMSPDPGAYRYHSGHGGIVTPSDPLPVVERALSAYGIRWLVVEREYLLPAYLPILTGTSRPRWLSEPVVVVPAESTPAATVDPALEGLPRAALFAVCLEPSDMRCR